MEKYVRKLKEEGLGRKVFYTMDNIGKVKYTVNYHDGVDTHPDGSPFYGIHTFKNKKKYEAFKKELVRDGYKEVSGAIFESKFEEKENSIIRRN
jgi:hypothetical protein